MLWENSFTDKTFFIQFQSPSITEVTVDVKQPVWSAPSSLFDTRCVHLRIPPLWQVRGTLRWMRDKRGRGGERREELCVSVHCMVVCVFPSLDTSGLCSAVDSASEICCPCWQVVTCCHICHIPKDSEEFNSLSNSSVSDSLNMKHTWKREHTPERRHLL